MISRRIACGGSIRAAAHGMFVILFFCSHSGCGGDSDAQRLIPVTGEVFVQQQPAAGALVVLHPAGELKRIGWSGGFPRAFVGEDGSFRITLHPLGEGAPEGEYKVVITWPMEKPDGDPEAEEPEMVDRLSGRYANPSETRLTAKVEAPSTELPRYELN